MLCASKAKEEQTRLRIDRALIPVRFSFEEMAYNKRGGEGSLHHIKHMLELPGGCNKASSVLCYTHTHRGILCIYICRCVGGCVCVFQKKRRQRHPMHQQGYFIMYITSAINRS